MTDRLDDLRSVALSLERVRVGACVIRSDGEVLLANQALAECLPFEAPLMSAGQCAPNNIVKAVFEAPVDAACPLGFSEDVVLSAVDLPGLGRFAAWRSFPADGTAPEAIIALREANQRLLELTLLDPLTGIANRRALDQQLNDECRRASRGNYEVALVLVDLDGFKALNDSKGHAAGDAALRSFAQVLSRRCRRPGDHCGRYGGDEFAIVLSGTSAEAASRIAEELRGEVERTPPLADCGVTVSIGIASAAASARPEAIMAAADAALYRAKSGGRNRVVVSAREEGRSSTEVQ